MVNVGRLLKRGKKSSQRQKNGSLQTNRRGSRKEKENTTRGRKRRNWGKGGRGKGGSDYPVFLETWGLHHGSRQGTGTIVKHQRGRGEEKEEFNGTKEKEGRKKRDGDKRRSGATESRGKNSDRVGSTGQRTPLAKHSPRPPFKRRSGERSKMGGKKGKGQRKGKDPTVRGVQGKHFPVSPL